ncbi:hypothetical protein Pelo_9548 [Pelomyxa schiedti]|nr:hypothetical protein Pelo_9548 [Pelomyxa schiedti]
MARELVGRSAVDSPSSGCCLLKWPSDDPDLIDDIREMSQSESMPHSVLYHACKGGNLEIVKWVMSNFSGVGTEHWELPIPFRAAVRMGHLDVVKWMTSTTDVVSACVKMIDQNVIGGCDIDEFIASPSLEVMKFCTGLFCGGRQEMALRFLYRLVDNFLLYTASYSGEDKESLFAEGWLWMKERFSVNSTHLNTAVLSKNGTAFKWCIENLLLTPRQYHLCSLCTGVADENLVEWLIANYAGTLGPVAPDTFIRACGNKDDSVSLVSYLLMNMAPPQLPLKPEQHVECLVKSLANNNTAVADWLEKTFHVMDHLRGSPTVAGQTFSKACTSRDCDGVGGVQWFLSHCAVSHIIREVPEVFCDRVERSCGNTASSLLRHCDNAAPLLFNKSRITSSIGSWCSILNAQNIVQLMQQS